MALFSRLRYLGAGAIAGFAASRISRMAEDEPDTLPTLGKKQETVALIRMAGTIEAPKPGAWPDKHTINLKNYESQLTKAFKSSSVSAVAIEMNSPGGSPVQSALLHNRLKALREEYKKPLLCYCTDVCASGGYYIASACDEIHCLPSSIVGSIGVVSPSVGLTGLMQKAGVEDRTLTAGTSKLGDNPLAPRDPIAVAKKRGLLEELHDDFKQQVSSARGEKLRHAEAAEYARKLGDRKGRSERATALFDGSVFGGKKAVEFGLADGLYDELGATLRRRFGAEIRVKEYGPSGGLASALQSMQESGAQALAAALVREAGGELVRASAGPVGVDLR